MKRAVAIAFVNAFSQLGNIAGSYIYPSDWAPGYRKSFGIALGCFVASICADSANHLGYILQHAC